ASPPRRHRARLPARPGCLSLRRIWIRSADFDRRIFLQAFRKLIDDLRNRRDDPGVVPGESVALLLQIGEEIDDSRQWESQRRVIHVLLPDKVHLPVSPFDSRQAIGDVGRKSFAVGVLLFAEEEIQLIDTVYRAIRRNLRSTHMGKGWIEVYN